MSSGAMFRELFACKLLRSICPICANGRLYWVWANCLRRHFKESAPPVHPSHHSNSVYSKHSNDSWYLWGGAEGPTAPRHLPSSAELLQSAMNM